MLTNKTIEVSRWNLYSWALMAFFCLFSVLKWPLTPTFIDIYYHLSVMLGFNDAGGFVSKSFWEYAPVGRPHLYPPLIHFLMLLVYKAGASPVTVGKIFECVIYPLFLLSLWQTARLLFSERLAFFALVVASSSYSLYLAIINFIPASVALMLGMFSFVFLERKRIIAAVLVLALSLYAHSGISWVFAASLLLYGIANRERLKDALFIVIVAVIAASPFLLYVWRLRRYVSLAGVYENFVFDIPLGVAAAALLGFGIAFKKRGRSLIFVALGIIALAMMMSPYKYRFICGQGVLGFVFLGALAVDAGYEYLKRRFASAGQKSLAAVYISAGIFFLFVIISPGIQIKKGDTRFIPADSTYVNFMPNIERPERGNEITVYFAKYWKELAGIIDLYSGQDDIIYSNAPYATGLLSVLSRRATSTAMLQEVKPCRDFDEIAAAKLIIWLKWSEVVSQEKAVGAFEQQPLQAIAMYHLRSLAETDIAYVYENPSPQGVQKRTRAVIPSWCVYTILGIVLGLIIWDNTRKKA